MQINLNQKIIYITGASRGIGLTTTRLLLEQGAVVIANARNHESADLALNALQTEFPELLHIKLYDVTDEAACKNAIREVHKSFGKIDGLVNNAGIMQESAIAMTPLNNLQQLLDVNVKSAYLHLQLLSRLMMRNKSGSIVNIASIVGEQGAKGQSAYSMSKASLSALTRSAAKELGEVNIRVNAVAPGFIETDLTSHYNAEQKQELLKSIPLKRLGTPEDVANTICFLLSPYAEYITGQVIGVDGALTLN